MAIYTKEITLIGANYNEICKAYFSAIASFSNVTGEGVTDASTTVYEYFTVTDGSYTYRFMLRGITSGEVMRCGTCNAGSTGGNCVTFFNMNNNSYSKTAAAKWYTYALYSHARLFYDENNNFIGASGLYAENYKAPYWFAFFHYKGKPLWFDSYNMYLHDMSASTPQFFSYLVLSDTSLDRNHDEIDSVYMESYLIEYTNMITYMTENDLLDEEVYAIYNNAFFTNTSTIVNGFMYIATEDGNFMMLYSNVWLRIEDIGTKETIIYNN